MSPNNFRRLALRLRISLAGLLLLAPAAALAQPPRAVAWTTVQVLPAAEAHQAAEADEQFLYAISSTQVARYDRRSGERLAVSRGDAQHLNSGFLRDGKLYCAHSNYPRLPERSEIKMLDTRTMELTTFHEFGNFGGSLTWAVYHDEHWWCNFARYGDDNAGTFLVKFTSAWQEAGRWTYPHDLVRQLGRYSLSGGVWQQGELLVTGHDDPLLFRLRLPEAGTTLTLLRVEGIPFTGQGIAHDPVTGGLAGINRRRREVLIATPPET
jgi:hypothetical protein